MKVPLNSLRFGGPEARKDQSTAQLALCKRGINELKCESAEGETAECA